MMPAEFLAWEREQQVKHEYFRGEVFAMSGGSFRHNALSVKVAVALEAAFAGRPCTTFSSDLRIGILDGYVYPDASVVCGPVESAPGTRDVLVNPSIVVEVVSRSTEDYDRGLKWEGYQRLASLGDYLLVSQREPRIEHFRRDPAGGWHYQAYGPGERVPLSGGASLEVDAIYAGVLELPADES